MRGQGLQRQQVSGWAETRNLAQCDPRDEGVMAKLLPLMDVRQVDFDRRQGHGGNRITYRNARMRVCGRIDDDPVEMSPGVLNPGDQFPFYIGLLGLYRNPQFRAPAGNGLVDVG